MKKVPLEVAHPELADQLVNQNLRSVLSSSDKRVVEWRCDKGHIWSANVDNRTNKNRGCPYCSGRLPIPGETDLATTRPDIACQLVDPSLATTLKETSHTKVAWKCEKGHVWEAPVASRTKNKSGCPYCSGRLAIPGETDLATTHPNLAAQLVDQRLATTLKAGSNKKVAWRCENGHVWECSPNTRVRTSSGCPYCSGRNAISNENDLLSTHPEIAAQLVDKRLARKLKANSNKLVFWRCKEGHVWEASVANRTRGNQGCPYCSGKRVKKGFNDLATVRPDLVQELVNPEDATKVTVMSHKVLMWKCKHSHTWDAPVARRTFQGDGCPYCSGKRILPGFNDLATTHPKIAAMLVNKELATQVSHGSNQIVKWHGECGHTWDASIVAVTSSDGRCPECYSKYLSLKEERLAEAICALRPDVTVLRHKRDILPDKTELDIVIPELGVAFEFNGLFWHSEAKKNNARNYHKKKTEYAAAAGYKLIHIWEDDWDDHRDIVLRMVAAKIGATKRLIHVIEDAPETWMRTIGARNLTFSEIPMTDAKRFLIENHIQGYVTSNKAFALKDADGNPVAVMTVRSGKAHGRTTRLDGTWEITRYATMGIIPGGFGKLLKHASQTIWQENLPLSTWLTFSDNAISDGNLYKSLGFTPDKQVPPDYYYVGQPTKRKRVPKESFQKKRFRDDPNLSWRPDATEHELALENSLYRIYDSGKTRWILHVSP